MPELPPTKPDDVDLAIRVLEDREAGCRLVLEVHGPRVKALLHKRFRDLLDAEELESVLGEAAARVVKSIEDDTYDTEKPLGPWFWTIAANVARETIRRESRNPRQGVFSDPPDEGHVPAEAAEDEDPRRVGLLEAVAEEIELLPVERRRVVKAWLAMQANPETDVSVAARRLGKTVGNFYATLNQAMKQLAQRLEQRGFSYP